jgi:hypothetical protein
MSIEQETVMSLEYALEKFPLQVTLIPPHDYVVPGMDLITDEDYAAAG